MIYYIFGGTFIVIIVTIIYFLFCYIEKNKIREILKASLIDEVNQCRRLNNWLDLNMSTDEIIEKAFNDMIAKYPQFTEQIKEIKDASYPTLKDRADCDPD